MMKMGMKIMKSHMNMRRPWCFQMNMMQAVEEAEAEEAKNVNIIKVVKWDGVVKIYEGPIQAAEVMVEFPKHQVCRSDSLYIGQKIPALLEQDELQVGHSYLVLPNHLFHSVLSFVTIASSSFGFEFDIHKTPSGCLRIRLSLSEYAKIQVHHRRLCTTPQLHKDYAHLVLHSRRQWKPKLHTISDSEPPSTNTMTKLTNSLSRARINKSLLNNFSAAAPPKYSNNNNIIIKSKK